MYLEYIRSFKMRKKSRRSLKRNRGRRGSCFKKGHPQFYHGDLVTSPECSEETEQLDSLTLNSRINSSEFPDVLSATANTGTESESEYREPGVLNYRLRPGREKDYSDCSGIKHNFVGQRGDKSNSNCENENIIVNIQKLEELFCAFAPHTCEASKSVGISVVERKGLCVSVIATCKDCGFKTPKTKLYTAVKSQRGPETGCINTMMLMPVLKSRIGINDLNLVMSCLNIRTPDERGLQRKLNKLTDQVEEMNKQQMIQNQQYVRRIQTFAGVPNQSDIEFDVSYSSRPQQGCERATQSFAPVIEQTTRKHLPISLETANKLCTKVNCQHNTNSCKRNYNPNESIQSTEPKLLRKNLETIRRQNIVKIRSVTTDASAQIAKAIQEYNRLGNYSIKHYKCFIHRMRSLHKQVKSLKLISIPKEYDKGIFSQKLASCLRIRIRLELTRYRKRFVQDQQYIKHARLAIENIFNCFQGKHNDCRQKSMVCDAHLPTYSTRYLPYGKHIALSSTDMDQIHSVLTKYLSPQSLKDMARLSTTNQCESIHSQLFRYAPKHTVWSRNFTGLCHSVAHTASLGIGTSLLKTAQLLRLPVSNTDPFYKYTVKIDSVSRFHGRRQASMKYKTMRHVRRKQKSNQKLMRLSVYGANRQIDKEHDYGINPVQ